MSLASKLFSVCIGFNYVDKKDEVDRILNGDNGLVTKANNMIKVFQQSIKERKETIEKDYFKQAMKELDDMDLAKFNNEPDQICKPFCEHLTSNYPHVIWDCFCGKVNQVM